MQMSFIYTLLSVAAVSAISLVGVLTIPFGRHMQRILRYFVSFSVGALLGDVFLHLLPEVVEEAGFGTSVSLWILSGIVATFILEKWVHAHHSHQDNCNEAHANPLGIMTLVGDGVHNMIDGMIIAASFAISIPVGVTTTFAVILHEIPQEIGNFGVLLHSGYSRVRALMYNLISALTAFIGVGLFLLLSERAENWALILSAAAAGNFIYIASSDMIPELHKQTALRSTFLQLVTMLAGVCVMWLLLALE